MNYYFLALKKAFDFKTKSSQKEFWYFYLINFLIFILIGFLERPLQIPKALILIYQVLILIPSISIGFRRLNDAGINKWLYLIPMVNIILACLPSKN
ncbi:DUF805 domain-containing protein [Mesoflavibacter zeaxanthinifaciens]|uniref:DUF805 domain-containing protein n=1 Tax=Mesoflavibacter zeaxanthinifaciens TaxID=393060 RepID=UPI0026F31F8A|nr:DUF805 domain-containing protein [Mesoflavibacter zeaxanthinifaciens]